MTSHKFWPNQNSFHSFLFLFSLTESHFPLSSLHVGAEREKSWETYLFHLSNKESRELWEKLVCFVFISNREKEILLNKISCSLPPFLTIPSSMQMLTKFIPLCFFSSVQPSERKKTKTRLVLCFFFTPTKREKWREMRGKASFPSFLQLRETQRNSNQSSFLFLQSWTSIKKQENYNSS